MSRAMPKYCRHPNGQAYIKTVRINGGQPLYLGPYGSEKSKLAYQRALKRLNADVTLAPELASDPDRTIVELIVAYQEFARRYYAKDGVPNQEYGEMVMALRPLDDRFGDTPAAEFGPRRLTRLQEHMVTLNLSRNVINHRIGRVKRFFRWCCKEEYVPQELYHGLACVEGLRKGRCNARETAKVTPIARVWVDATLPFMTPTVAAMTQMQLYCGMRPAEVCAMRGRHINRSGPIWIYNPPEHKNAWRDIVRVIAIPKIAQRILEPFLKTDPEAYLFSPRESEGSATPVAWARASRTARRRSTRASCGLEL